MGQPSEALRSAWRALSGDALKEGWRTISISGHAGVRVLAGRYFPSNTEALIVGFSSAKIPPPPQLPAGHGFSVQPVSLTSGGTGVGWIALSRNERASSELFSMMAEDVLSGLSGTDGKDERETLQAFLARIRAWQDFMRRADDGLLNPEAEMGLFGELVFLRRLLSEGVLPQSAVEAWVGPIDGLHDFTFGTGAIEVKTSTASDRFVAKISSLRQLDDSLVSPLFLACVKLQTTTEGQSLPEQVTAVRKVLSRDSAATSLLDTRLMHGGYADAAADRYTRRFAECGQVVRRVVSPFPRLTRHEVPPEVTEARYELTVDLASGENVSVKRALEQLGSI